MVRNKNRTAPKSRQQPAQSPLGATLLPDIVNLTLLAGMAVYFAQASWFKWPDPQVDFGRELYLPWRIAQGAVLYINELHLYGPLSPYLNSLAFRIGGASLTTLITANVVVYSAILFLIYYLARAGWGRWAAFVSAGFFVGAFSFSHLSVVNNYNFLTPYCHEITHGMLLVLCLILVLRRVVRSMGAGALAAAGLLAGLSILEKPEIILTASAVVAGAILLIVKRDFYNRPWKAWLWASGIFLVTGFIPMTTAALLLWRAGLSPVNAIRYANFAWKSVLEVGGLMASDPFQQVALGLSTPWQNIAAEAIWGGAAVACVVGLAWGAGHFRKAGKFLRILLSAIFLLAVAAATRVPWMNIGRALPGILIFGAVIEILLMRTAKDQDADDRFTVRALVWMAAAAMLARMALNPRIFHYGFAQAALAGVVGVAIILSSLPPLMKLDAVARRLYQAILTLLVAALVVVVASTSIPLYAFHTQPVGAGADQFYSFDQNVDPAGLLIEQARQYLEKDIRENNVQSLLVLPEGVMLNYLTRLPNTIPYYFFGPFVLADGRSAEILRGLQAAPPDRIVILSRDMREFGVNRFGESTEHGRDLVEFVNQNYKAVYSFGDSDPLDPDQIGLLIFARKSNP